MHGIAITLDLDGPREYAGLHGLEITVRDPLVMYRGPLERFASLCRRLGGCGTLFAVARDVVSDAASALRQLSRDGFEVACHSYAHDYRLALQPAHVIRDDLLRARDRIAATIDRAPSGFRAPGYNLSAALLDELERIELVYDSSVMPSPPYYAAKAAVLGMYWALRRRSTSVLGPARSATAPRRPYHPGHSPYSVGSRELVELPIAVATGLRLPVTGASVVLAPPLLRSRLLSSMRSFEMLVVNLHAVDFADVEADGLPPELARVQPELRIPLATRTEILLQSLAELATGRRILTCLQMARVVRGEQEAPRGR